MRVNCGDADLKEASNAVDGDLSAGWSSHFFRPSMDLYRFTELIFYGQSNSNMEEAYANNYEMAFK